MAFSIKSRMKPTTNWKTWLGGFCPLSLVWASPCCCTSSRQSAAQGPEDSGILVHKQRYPASGWVPQVSREHAHLDRMMSVCGWEVLQKGTAVG